MVLYPWSANTSGNVFRSLRTGACLRSGLRKYTPLVCGYLPVIILAREGLHTGDWQWALLNKVPTFASLSILGVFACGWPPIHPTQSLRSSIEIKSTFGLVWENAKAVARTTPIPINIMVFWGAWLISRRNPIPYTIEFHRDGMIYPTRTYSH